MSIINSYGFNDHFANACATHPHTNLFPGRVICIRGQQFRIVTNDGEINTELVGNLLNTSEEWELPKVGDWVVYTSCGDRGYITRVLERRSELSRKKPGKRMEKQVVATNIDAAMVVLSIDQRLNPMRLQRYLHQLFQNQIEVIVLLNKSDLAGNPADYQKHMDDLGYQVPVMCISTVSHLGLRELEGLHMKPGKTYVLLGQSGVGKSSLYNYLTGVNAHSTSAISSAHQKGRHTTSYRELSLLRNGSLIIDTPGTREFGITAEDQEEPWAIHPAILVFSSLCKFPDCRHEAEPGCAVKQAVLTGELSELVYRSYLKLSKEHQRYLAAVRDQRRRDKQHGKIARQMQILKRKSQS